LREFLFLLAVCAIVGGGGWAMVQHMQRQEKRIEELTQAIETQGRLVESAQRAAQEASARQTVIVRERDHAREEIKTAVGSGEMVPPDVWRATRDAIQRMRDQAGSAAQNRGGNAASQPAAGL